MASQLQLFCVGLFVLFGLTLTNGAQPSIHTNKLFLSEQDGNIQFTCSGDEVDDKTVVIFNLNGQQVFNSSGQIANGVTKVNQTSMITTDIKNGIVNANCKINSTSSQSINQIPYVAPVTFAAVPNKFKVGRNFSAICGVQVKPLPQVNFNVTFTKDKTIIALFTIEGRSAIWRIVPKVSWIDISIGDVNATIFSAEIHPKTKEAEGSYACYVSLPIGRTYPRFPSRSWKTSASFAVMPSIALLVAWLIFCLLFSFNYSN